MLPSRTTAVCTLGLWVDALRVLESPLTVLESFYARKPWSGDQDTMLFSGQTSNISTAGDAQSSTGPAAVVWNGALYVFYAASAEKNAIHCFTSTDGASWTVVNNPPLRIASGTSPCAVVWNEELYLFCAVGSNGGKNGIQYATLTKDGDGVWGKVQSMTISSPMNSTSPSAVVWEKKLYLFYTGLDGAAVYGTACENGQWASVECLKFANGVSQAAVSAGASPATAVLGENLYVFYNSANGIGYVNFKDTIGNQRFVCETNSEQQTNAILSTASPGPLAFMQSLYLFYSPGNSIKEIWYTTTADGLSWSQVAAALNVSTQASPSVIEYKGSLFLVWNDSSTNQISMSRTNLTDIPVSISGKDWIFANDKNLKQLCFSSTDMNILDKYVYSIGEKNGIFRSASVYVYPNVVKRDTPQPVGTPARPPPVLKLSVPAAEGLLTEGFYSYCPLNGQQAVAFSASITSNSFSIVVLDVNGAVANFFIGIILSAQTYDADGKLSTDVIESPDPQILLGSKPTPN